MTYATANGMQTIDLTKDAGWEIGVSRVVKADRQAVWDLLTGPRGVELWLGEGVVLPQEVGQCFRSPAGTCGEVRSFRPLDRVRLLWQPCGWDHPSTLQVEVSPGAGGTTVRFHQERLAGPQEREVQRWHWKAVLDRLEEQLVPAT